METRVIIRKGDYVRDLIDDVKFDRRRDCDNTILRPEPETESQDLGLAGEIAPVVVKTGVRMILFKFFGVTP